jgi:hypothetical protein
MKHYILLYITIIGFTFLASCKKDEDRAVVNGQLTGPAALNVPDIDWLLKPANAGNILQFTWTPVNYGFTAPVKYTLQAATHGSDFSNPVNIASIYSKDTLKMTLGDFDASLIAGDFSDNLTSVDLRISAYVNDSVKIVYSPVVTKDITPYSFPKLKLLSSKWNDNVAPGIYSPKSNGNYEGYVYIAEPNTQFTFNDPIAGTNYGDTNGKLAVNGGSITVSSAGYYKVNASPSGEAYSLSKTTWSVIGNATAGGWSTDTPMTFDPDKKVWTATLDMTKQAAPSNGWKFRANNDWALNYGDTGADGVLDLGGDNIGCPADGNYTITLMLSKPIYKYSIVKN